MSTLLCIVMSLLFWLLVKIIHKWSLRDKQLEFLALSPKTLLEGK